MSQGLLIPLTLILALASFIPSSTSNQCCLPGLCEFIDVKDRNDYLHDQCLSTGQPTQCWEEIITPNYEKFNNKPCGLDNAFGVALGFIEISKQKAVEIADLLNQLENTCDNNELKKMYTLCANDYNDVIRDLNECTRYLHTREDWYNITSPPPEYLINGLIKPCLSSFNETSVDPANIRGTNEDFLIYVQLVKGAVSGAISYILDA